MFSTNRRMILIRQSSSRSFLAIGLISALLMMSGQPVCGQTGQAQSPRRGKNGVPTPENQNSDDSRPTSGDSSSEKAGGGPANPKAGDTTRDPDRSRREVEDRVPVQDKSTAEPPPFDRPSVETSTGSENRGSSRRSTPRISSTSTEPRSRTGADDRTTADPAPRSNDRSGPSDSSYDLPPATRPRDGREPPVLKREPSSAPQSQERERPVLKRSPSSTTPAEDRPRQENGDQTNSPRRSDPSPSGSGSDDTVKLSSTLVNIPLLVSDRNGRYIPKLSQRDFDLYEDGVKQEVAFFSSEEVPFSVALLLDVSPSVSGNLSDIQDAALEFIRQLRPQDRVMVVSFDRRVRFLTDFTSDRRTLEYAIQEAHTGSGTSVYEAVYDTVTRRMTGVEGRKALILFSDGEDTTSSHASYDDAVSAVSESEVLVYGLRYPGSGSAGAGGGNNLPWPFPRTRNPLPLPFPFPWPWPRRPGGHFNLNHTSTGPAGVSSAAAFPPQRRRGRAAGDFMSDVAAAGGGPVYDAQGVHDLSRLARQIAEELRHVYVISYYPTNALSNGGYRALRVHVPNRPDIIVRCRRGYDARDVTKGH
ncbi:MAG: hypothetical protein DMF61_18720 [Blastocatellia bacterium AA13]|nr:MAG: hypothetical protein DMF61_18720 [Blastocatellia bacterium AA13]